MTRTLTRLALMVLILLGLVVAIQRLWALVEAPWSIEGSGPTLTGTWVGPLRARLGGRYHLFVEVGYDVPGRTGRGHAGAPWGRAPLWGTGAVCAANGAIHDYALSGTATRSGDRVELHLGAPSGVARAPWFALHGSWRGDTLDVRPTRNPFDPDGVYRPERPTSSDDPDDPFGATELHKGSVADFEAACRELGLAME